MLRIVFALISLLFLAAARPSHAVDVPVEARVHNVGGYCTWASLDTAARTLGIPELQGVMEQRRQRNNGARIDGGLDHKIEAELNARGVRYQLRKQFSGDRSLLEKYADAYGVVVSFKEGTPYLGCHSVYVTKYDSDPAGFVHYYDSSKPLQNGEPKIWRVGRQFFDYYWLGSSVVVFPPGSAPDTAVVSRQLSPTFTSSALASTKLVDRQQSSQPEPANMRLPDGSGGWVRLVK